ncbi:MAG: hypothetical protein IJE14_03050 [Clostridia bacterium]|nr:hypothetical protein [Clostridia bacterium]
MELNKILDYAIMADETAKNPEVKSGYNINEKTYNNYLSNDSFAEFVEDMKTNHPVAYEMYGKGGGKELEERVSGKNIYPPKMASFGSSSRMIYNMMKDKEGFLFEKKLPTTVGGIANLDGFIETDEKCVFVEAKCREPYTQKDSIYERKYEDLYRTISASSTTSVACKIEVIDERKMEVKFVSGETEINSFDMKQMISHLLGVATAYLKGEFDKKIDFIYLLFNPKLIEIKESKEEIHRIYEQTRNECNSVDFKALFKVIVEYLQTVKGLGKEKNKIDIVKNFSFRLCDQSNMNI